MADRSASTRFRGLFDNALRAYEKDTGVTLASHPLAVKLQGCNSVEGIAALLQDQAKKFKKSEKITESMQTIVSILTPLSFAASESLPDTVGLSFPPSKAVQACLGVLLDAAKNVLVISSREVVVNVLESIGQFVGRLKIERPLSSAMVEIVVQIMVELISLLALETKKFTRRRLVKSIKRLWGDKEGSMDVQAVLQRLDRLTQYEHLNAAAQTLKVVSDRKTTRPASKPPGPIPKQPHVPSYVPSPPTRPQQVIIPPAPPMLYMGSLCLPAQSPSSFMQPPGNCYY